MSRCECPSDRICNFESPKKHKKSKKDILWKQLNLSSGHEDIKRFKAYLGDCKFKLVKDVILTLGGISVNYKHSWVLAWIDGVVSLEVFSKLKSFQRINHFPGMSEICKKDLLALNLKKMKNVLPKEFNFFPLTFCLPDEARNLHAHCDKPNKKNGFFIIKPDKNCQGIGIEIVKGIHKVKKYYNVVCQKYICKPLLMETFKFDIRIYVLITSIIPLRIYVYNEGMIRLATIPYKKPTSSNMNEYRMHLTNYAINRTSNKDKEQTEERECKKSFADLNKLLISNGVSPDQLWSEIDNIIVKTILCALPSLEHMFHTSFPISTPISSCFELLGFDVLLDADNKPYLLEVNRSPSLDGSIQFDKELKRNLVRNVLDMVLLTKRQVQIIKDEEHMKCIRRLTNPNETKQLTETELLLSEYQEQKEKRKRGDFRLLYPAADDRFDEVRRVAFALTSRMDSNTKDSAASKPSPVKLRTGTARIA